MTKRILIFPCGSEIGLEIYRSLCYSVHFELIGGSSVDDHGSFVYEEYIGNLPYHDHPDFIRRIQDVVKKYNIDAIYPAMDAVAETLTLAAANINCIVIGSEARVNSVCSSKALTYELLSKSIDIPNLYSTLDEIEQFPIYIKPDRGYGSRNTLLANFYNEAKCFLDKNYDKKMLLLEYLPGREWTIDCFSDRNGVLHFSAARGRNRINNGISVNTSPSNEFRSLFTEWANNINLVLKPRGAWFYQVKLDKSGNPRLLEVASRLGGSSAMFRCKGVNFALLTVFDAFDKDVCVHLNKYDVELDRALDNRYKLNIEYDHVFVDLDDCLIIRGSINYQLIGFLYKSLSKGKGVTLLTRHAGDILQALKNYRIFELFDRVIKVNGFVKKSDLIDIGNSIFIDDSYKERHDVAKRLNIPVFSPDMIEVLL